MDIVNTILQRQEPETPAPDNDMVDIVVTEAGKSGLHIMEPEDWASIVTLESLSDLNYNEVISAINSANPPIKVAYDKGDRAPFIEIRPPIQRVPNEGAMYVEMIDSSMRTCMFVADDGTVIQALKLSPNPDSIIVNSSKIVNRYNTMTRWVEEHWGDEIDTITISGSSFSLMSFQPQDNPTGLTVSNRNSTAAYLYFKELIRFYRTNGCLFQDNAYDHGVSDDEAAKNNDAVSVFLKGNPTFIQNHPMRGMIKERTLVRITLDYTSFLGYFENFDLIEDSNIPYRFTYNITFKSERTKLIVGV